MGLDLFTEYVSIFVILQSKLFALFQINKHVEKLFFVMDERSQAIKYVRTTFGLLQNIIKLWIIVFIFLVHTILVMLLFSFVDDCHAHCALHSIIFKKFILNCWFFVIDSMRSNSA